MGEGTDNEKCEVATRAQPSIAKEVMCHALHARVLIVYVANIVQGRVLVEGKDLGWRGDWKAYCVPVPGVDHEAEKHLYATEGVAVTEGLARYLWGALTEQYDKRGLPWRD